jgi:Protein of unknown function (DUF2637)
VTIGVAACAFVISFDALRDLAEMLGWPGEIAKLVPLAIDLSITNSTLALLSLTPPRAGSGASARADAPQRARDGGPDVSATPDTRNGAPVQPGRVTQPDSAVHGMAAIAAGPAPSIRPAERSLAAVPDAPAAPADPAALVRWRLTADELVRSGVTSKDPQIVAAVLAEHAAGTPPTTIGRRLDVHHTTVGRILAGAQGLTG